MSSNWFHSTYPCEYSNNVFHASNTTASNLKTPQHVRGTVYEGNLVSSVRIEQTIIQASSASTLNIYEEPLENSKVQVVNKTQVVVEICATSMHTVSTGMLCNEQKWDKMCKKLA